MVGGKPVVGGKRVWLDYWGEALTWSRAVGIFSVVLITFLVIDFYKVKDSAAGNSYVKFNRYFANVYPDCVESSGECWLRWSGRSKEREDEGKKQEASTSVVLWTDKDLERSDTNKSWPVKWGAHAKILGKILNYEPKAVAVDLLFVDEPSARKDNTHSELARVICRYQKKGVGLYLIGPSGPDVGFSNELSKEIMKRCGLDLNQKNNGHSVRLVSAEISDHARVYPYRVGMAARGGDADVQPAKDRDPQDRKSLAVEMYEDYLNDRKKEDEGKKDERISLESKDFHIFWKIGKKQEHLALDCRGEDDTGEDENFPVFPDHLLEVFVNKIFEPFKEPYNNEGICPYIPTITADNFHVRREEGSEIQKYIDGKFVFYGAALHGMGDLYQIPILDDHRLPGVYVHAMALDNLVEMRGNVYHLEREWPAEVFYYIISAFFATLLFIFVLFIEFNMKLKVRSFLGNFDLRSNKQRAGRRLLSSKIEKIAIILEIIINIGFEILVWMFVVSIAGFLLITFTWIIYNLGFSFENFRFILNWIGIIVVSGLPSVWAKLPMMAHVRELISLLKVQSSATKEKSQ